MQAYKAILIKNLNLPPNGKALKALFVTKGEMVPPVGIEPTTYGLQNRCSTN